MSFLWEGLNLNGFHPILASLPEVRSCLAFCGPGAAAAAVSSGMIHRKEGSHGGVG